MQTILLSFIAGLLLVHSMVTISEAEKVTDTKTLIGLAIMLSIFAIIISIVFLTIAYGLNIVVAMFNFKI